MDQLPDIDHWLVTPDNPPRNQIGLDHERCVALYNYLLQYSFAASNKEFGDRHKISWFEKHGDKAERAREHLDPSLIKFLENAYDPRDADFAILFYWVRGINDPTYLWTNWEDFSNLGEEHGRMTLFYTNCALLGCHQDGLCYDQQLHKAVVFISIHDQDFASGDENSHLWYPLETILRNWITVLRMGKITAEPDDVKVENDRYRPWTCHRYSTKQVEDTVTAFNRLADAIESRIPSTRKGMPPVRNFSHELMDATLIPNPSFARSFLSAIGVPAFKYIAPGLLIPTEEDFAKNQILAATENYDKLSTIPAVLLFKVEPESASQEQQGLNAENKDEHTRKPAGLYTEETQVWNDDIAEEGFRLILPYSIAEHGFARKRTGHLIEQNGNGGFEDLYQHGFKPFGGDWSRAQRLVRLFDNWTGMVEKGLWEVGPDGVMGGIEKFKEADSEEGWRNYWIESD
ncbi:uncharacterized protein LY89DRAFT_657341 [Mollisia scopiformis]|uniref:Uncharacterized protein n=1 Tax=Mollisia scopiformis TaxID=149040 RepID=A0A132BBQ5_MOLSC|nr:uncharacterized protein LY89DRAFT_657341 [Mollisia scopiformis]KUJ09811.1 hypothetical protein LY89DRAFT_657341 [Mollisia scopiformis]